MLINVRKVRKVCTIMWFEIEANGNVSGGFYPAVGVSRLFMTTMIVKEIEC